MIETHPTLAQQEFIAKEMLHRRNVRILRIMLLVLLLALWELCARLGIINDFIFSSPSRMTICFISMVKDGTIFLHTGVTVMETLVSFALVVVVGLATAILLWSSTASRSAGSCWPLASSSRRMALATAGTSARRCGSVSYRRTT